MVHYLLRSTHHNGLSSIPIASRRPEATKDCKAVSVAGNFVPSKDPIPRSSGIRRLLISQLDTLDVNIRDALQLTMKAIMVRLDIIPLMLRVVLRALKEVLLGLDGREVLSSRDRGQRVEVRHLTITRASQNGELTLPLILTLLIKFGGLLGQVICQIYPKATLSVNLAHPNSLEIKIDDTLLICNKDFGQMINSVWVLELLRPSSSYGGLLKTHLSFLLFKVKQSLLDICAAHCATQVSRGLRIQLSGHLRMPSGMRHCL